MRLLPCGKIVAMAHHLIQFMSMTEPDRNSVAQDILTYLLANTRAEDTVEGIVEWWLLEEKIKNRTREVQEVLDELVAQSLICERKSEDARVRYRINEHKLDEIRELLKKPN